MNIKHTTLQAAGLYYAERGRNRCKQPSASLSLVRCRRYQLLTGYAVTDCMRNKLLMLGPERNSEFCFPRISSKETLRPERSSRKLVIKRLDGSLVFCGGYLPMATSLYMPVCLFSLFVSIISLFFTLSTHFKLFSLNFNFLHPLGWKTAFRKLEYSRFLHVHYHQDNLIVSNYRHLRDCPFNFNLRQWSSKKTFQYCSLCFLQSSCLIFIISITFF